MLSDKKDRYGCNLLKSDWQYTDRDIMNIVENHRVLLEDVDEAPHSVIRLNMDSDSLYQRAKDAARLGSHHIGITRMSADCRHGVVDRDCRVHAVSNLYVGGSGVFPTSSCKSVTLLIVAIALRVADAILAQLPHQGN